MLPACITAVSIVETTRAVAPKAGVSLEQLVAQDSVGESFQQWEKVAAALELKTMPPKSMPQPSGAERAQAITWIRTALHDYAKKYDGDPGQVTVRRLTSGEYAWMIRDLTGLDLNVGIDSTSGSVGGEVSTNFGDVQFMQDAWSATWPWRRSSADHGVIGSGPLEFFSHPGRTGFEMSAVERIREIYSANGFRTVSGEGGRPFARDYTDAQQRPLADEFRVS